MHLNSLPEDLLVEIFNKLSPKLLTRCTTVCKSWFNLIKNPKFVSANLKSNTNNPAILMLAFRNDSTGVKKSSHACLQLDNEKLDEYKHLFFPFFSDHPTKPAFNVAGCCNGVVCLFGVTLCYGYKCILWNPSIGKYIRLPKPTLPFVRSPCTKDIDDVYGFWHDSVSEDFKVVRIVNTRLNNKPLRGCEVYSLKSRAWKIILVGNHITVGQGMRVLSLYNNDGSNFVKDSLHWPAIIGSFEKGCSPTFTGSILVFNVMSEEFSVIELPECLKALNITLCVRVHNESTIMAFNSSYWRESKICDIWVMKEYGVLKSWVKLCTIDKTKIRPSNILMFRKSGELLVQLNNKHIVSHNFDTQKYKYLIRSDQEFYGIFVHSYVWSLYLLHEGKDVYSYKRSLESNLEDREDNCKEYKYNEATGDEEIINILSQINTE